MRLLHGIDVVEVERVEELLSRHGERFLDRCFTAGEQAYAMTKKKAGEHLAARFAAKEAALKALGTGLRDGIQWRDVEVTHNGVGAPQLVLHGQAAEVAARLGVIEWGISLSHTRGLAMASVIGTIGRVL